VKSGKVAMGGCLLLAATVAAFLYPFRSVQPVFKGKTAREYVYNLGGSAEGSEAMRHFGTNALPDISSALRVRDTAARRALMWLAAHQTIVKVHVRSAEDIHFSALFAYQDILELVHERWLPPEVADRCAIEISALAVQGGIDESNACVDVLGGIKFVKTNFWSSPPPIEDKSIPIANGNDDVQAR
jgi:hypothetical protein